MHGYAILIIGNKRFRIQNLMCGFWQGCHRTEDDNYDPARAKNE